MKLLIPNLQPGTLYAIQVRSDDGAAQSEWSPALRLTTTVDSVLPKTPTGFTFVSNGDAFLATWNTVTQNNSNQASAVVRYELELTANSVVKVVSIPQSSASTLTFNLEFENNRALFGSPRPQVSARVRAVDNKGLASNWTSSTSTSNPAPQAPGSVVATAKTNLIEITWTAPTDNDVIGYNVYNSSDVKLAFINATTYSYTTDIKTAQTLKVSAVDKFGQESLKTTSNSVTPGAVVVTDGQPPATPTAPVLTQALGGFYVTWSPITTNALGDPQLDPVTYEVHISTANDFSPTSTTKAAEISATAITLEKTGGGNKLSYDTTYYVKLRAKDRDGFATGSSPQASGQIGKVASGDVISIGANLIVPGTGLISNLVIATGGSIQSNNYSSTQGWKISPTGIEMNDANSKIKADAITAGTWGSTTGVITIASGASLVLDGGSVRSQNYNSGSAGWSLGGTGLEINQGTIRGVSIYSALFSTSSTVGEQDSISIRNNSGVGIIEFWQLNQGGSGVLSGSIKGLLTSSAEGLRSVLSLSSGKAGSSLSSTIRLMSAGGGAVNGVYLDADEIVLGPSSGGLGVSANSYIYATKGIEANVELRVVRTDGGLLINSASNINGRIRTLFDGGGALAFSGGTTPVAAVTGADVNTGTYGSASTIPFYARELYTFGDVSINHPQGGVIITSASNIAAKIRHRLDSGAALVFQAGNAGITTATMNGTSFTASNTANFYVNTIYRVAEATLSDRRDKKNILAIDKASSLDLLKKVTINEFSFSSDNTGAVYRGVIAQELKEVLPTAVNTYNSNRLSVNYDTLYATHIAATQELAGQHEALQQAFAASETGIVDLSERNEELQAQVAALAEQVAALTAWMESEQNAS